MYEKWKSEYLLNIWIFVDVHSYLRLFIWLASKSQLSTKMLPKMMFSWKSQLIFLSIANLHSNVCNFYFLIWLRCFQLMFSSLTIYWINTNFHFSFLFRLRFLSIDFFSISKYTIYLLIWLRYLSINIFLNDNTRINTNFHFSFPLRLRFLSIDFSQSVNAPTSYIQFFHFSFLVGLRLWSIDIFLNL